MEKTKSTAQKRTQRDYSLTFKLSVVGQVERGELTYKQAQKRFGIQGKSTVLVWLRKHGKLDWTANGVQMSKPMETPEQKIKRLEQQLKDAEDRNYLYKEMLKHVDRDLGTDYVKKSLSAQRDRHKPEAN